MEREDKFSTQATEDDEFTRILKTGEERARELKRENEKLWGRLRRFSIGGKGAHCDTEPSADSGE
jgi:hypothetical protein